VYPRVLSSLSGLFNLIDVVASKGMTDDEYIAANRGLDEKLGRKSLPRQRYQLNTRNL
jgi:hypothetical protein